MDLERVWEDPTEKCWKQRKIVGNLEEIKCSVESVLHVNEWNEAGEFCKAKW